MKDSYSQHAVTDWVMDKCESWREHYESNYVDKHQEYYRLWRGIWDSSDSLRQSERSKIISPALQQAVESSVAEVEEATFGRGKWFDIHDDHKDQDDSDIAYLRTQLEEDFKYTKTRKEVAECILNSAVYGTGIAEIVLEEVKEMKPATQPLLEGELEAVGVTVEDRFVVKLRSVLPQNFLIDPSATSIDSALGVAIDSFVPIHQVHQDIAKGYYFDVDIETAASDYELEATPELNAYTDDKVRLTKYYGLVPSDLFHEAMESELEEGEELIKLTEEEEEDEDKENTYVEAVIVIANGGQLLKIEKNPYMMGDRPVVAFPWDVVPSSFWGRGVCEKGYNSQKALDTELRARIDALALTIHPMMAIDATRLPRGMKPEIRPGKILLTNGNPSEVLRPFNFGALDQTSFAQTSMLQQMVQQATGAVDTASLSSMAGSEGTAAGLSMSLGALIKRHKRTLINFQELFLLPMVQKTAWRYMQFDPENYPIKDFKFVASSSLGIIAREYEVTQLVQLLQTMQQDSPMYPMLIESILENMNISNREELIGRMKQSQEPNPEAQQKQQMQMQVQMAKEQATAAALNAQAAEANERANKYKSEVELAEYEAQTNRIKALSTNLKEGDGDDKEFERRIKTAELLIKEKAIDAKASARSPREGVLTASQSPIQQQGMATDVNTDGNQENSGTNQRGF